LREAFFFEKKNQKTLTLFGALCRNAGAGVVHVFWVSSMKNNTVFFFGG
jgi:hypothetical protein